MKITEIQRIDEITPEKFKSDFLQTNTPLIFRTFSESWQAAQQWDFEFFRNYSGHLQIPVSGDWSKNNSTQIDRGVDYKMTFNEFLNAIENGPTEYRLFAFNLFKSQPELKKYFNYPNFANRWFKAPFLFFGGEGSNVRLHYDFDNSDVFLTQFSGIKKITLFHPKYSKLLYRQPFTTHSHLNISSEEFKTIPSYPLLEALTGKIECGDTLFMPANFWHFIEYETGGFSLALRSLNQSNLKVIMGGIVVFGYTNMDKLLGKISPNKWAQFKLKSANKQVEKTLSNLK
ncbi:MAG: cupin-like domain-containing protein [Bacteroidota bacterium]